MSKTQYQERILIVDDNNHMRALLKDALKTANFSVLIARDGVEGMEKIRAARPDLILLDYKMPRMDGLAVLDALNTEGFDIPVILMTAEGDEEIAVKVFRKGVKDYIIKGDTFDPDEFLTSIQRSLRETRLQREKDDLVSELQITTARLKRQMRDMRTLFEVGRNVTAMMDTDELWQHIVAAAIRLTGSEEASVYLSENGQAVCRALKQADDEQPITVSLPTNDPLILHCIEQRKMISQQPEVETKGAFVGTATITVVRALAAPMIYGGQVIGALMVRNVSPGATIFSDHEARLLNTLADYAVLAFKTRDPKGALSLPDKPKTRKVFISYKREDYYEYVEPLVELLQKHGITDFWLDQDRLEVGQDWVDKIEQALDECSVMVLCVSPDALASRYVQIEYHTFFHQGKPIVPLVCKPAVLPPTLMGFHAIKYAEKEKVVSRLKILVER